MKFILNFTLTEGLAEAKQEKTEKVENLEEFLEDL